MSNVEEVAKGRSTDKERGQRRRKLEANERFVSRKKTQKNGCEEGSTCRKQNLKLFRTNYNIFPFNNYILLKNEKQPAQTCNGCEILPIPEKHSVIHIKNMSMLKSGRSSCPNF